MFVCACVGGMREEKIKPIAKIYAKNWQKMGEKGKFLFFLQIIHNFFLEDKFASIFSMDHLG